MRDYNYKSSSIVSVDMDKVGVMAAYCDPRCVCVVCVCVCVCVCVIVATHCTRLPDDGSSVIRNMLEHF